MTSTNDGKDVKSIKTSGQKGKTYYIELYKSLDGRLTGECDLHERTRHLCEAWRRVHSLCQHSAQTTHPHLLSWLQRHTARTILQTEWQSPKSKDDQTNLEAAIDDFIKECKAATASRNGVSPPWEKQLQQRAEWFKRILENPWGHPVLRVLLDPRGQRLTDDEILNWLKEERGVMFVTRLRQLATSKCDDLAMALVTAVMDRARAAVVVVPDNDQVEEPTDKPVKSKEGPTFADILKTEAGFTVEVWELLTDIEFVLLHKGDRVSKCIELAKQTPLRNGYQLVERLQARLETSPREKKLWKNAKEVAILIAQVVIARCMLVPVCAGAARTALYCCSRALSRLLPSNRLPAAAASLAAPASTARHLHTLAAAVDAQCSSDMKPFVCELYVRAITAGMNELERFKLKTEKESDARSTEQTLCAWFNQLGLLLSKSDRIKCECTLTAFSVHPSPDMYEKIKSAPALPPVAVLDDQELKPETTSEFGSWATDSRTQTNLVKTSETLNMKHTQNQANILSTAIFAEGEALGLSPEVCQDIAVLLSGPRVKTLSWDMNRELLLENCRTYMERTHGGTRALTTELKYLNLDPSSYQHLPIEEDDENDIYYGIEKGYEHLVELQEPEDIWETTLFYTEATESACSSGIESEFVKVPRKKKTKKLSISSDDESDPLSLVAETKKSDKKKERPLSKERLLSKERPLSKEIPVSKELHVSKEIPMSKEKTNQDKSSTKEKNKERMKKTKSTEGSSENKERSRERWKDSESKQKDTTVAKEKKKEKKARKKKLKEEKQPVLIESKPGSLSSLIGMKVAKIKIPEGKYKKTTETKVTPCITDSDYDSQGKSSLASINSEGIESDVLFDGLFSMDDYKSPDKNEPLVDRYSLSHNQLSFLNGQVQTMHIPTNPDIDKSNIRSLPQYRQQNLSPSIASNANREHKIREDVKKSITKLLEFRRQKNLLEEAQKALFLSPYSPNKIISKTSNTVIREQLPEQTVMSPKVEDHVIPKVNINKHQVEQLNELKTEVDNYLKSKFSTKPVIQFAGKQNVDNNTPAPTYEYQHLPSNQETNLPLSYQQMNFGTSYPQQLTPTSNVTQIPRIPPSLDSSSQKNFQDFVRELQETINAGTGVKKITKSIMNPSTKSEIKPVSRVTPIIPNSMKKESLSQCAKPLQGKKVETQLNTFARLSYMHKNKQHADALNSQCDQYNILNRSVEEHKNAKIKYLQAKGEVVITRTNTIQNTANNESKHNAILKAEKPHTVSVDHPLITNLIYNNQGAIPKRITGNDVLKNVSLQPEKTKVSKSYTKHTSLSERDQNDLLLLLRQQTKLNTQPSTPVNTDICNINKITNYSQCTKTNTAYKPTPTASTLTVIKNPAEVHADYSNNSSRFEGTKVKIEYVLPINDVNSKKMHCKTTNVNKTVSSKGVNITQVAVNTPLDGQSILNRNNVPNSTSQTIDTSQQDWEKVMDAILSHKTPSRGPNALDMVLKKKTYSDLRNQRIVRPNMSSDPNNSKTTSNCEKPVSQEFKSSTVLTQNVISDKERKQQSSKPDALKKPASVSIQEAYKQLQSCSKIVSHKSNPPKKLQQNLLRTTQSPELIKKLVCRQEVERKPCGQQQSVTKQVSVQRQVVKTSTRDERNKPAAGDSQKKQSTKRIEKDPFISGIPNSDYDLLEELMDDDLRKEIGELSSDEDAYQAPITSGVKGVKIISSNSKSNNVIKGALASQEKVQTVSGENAQRSCRDTIIKCNQTHVLKSNNKAKTENEINASTSTPSLINVAKTKTYSTNCKLVSKMVAGSSVTYPTVSHHSVSTNVTYNQNKEQSSRLVVTNPINVVEAPNVIIAAVPQPTLQNVVLIGSDIVFDPYIPMQTQLQSGLCNVKQAPYVAYNNVPNITVYQTTQFAAPVVNPVIIGNAMTTPTMSNLPSARLSNVEVALNSSSKELNNKKNVIESQDKPNHDKDKRSDEMNNEIEPVTENCTQDQLKQRLEEQENKISDINSNKICERKVLSEVQEKQQLIEKSDTVKCKNNQIVLYNHFKGNQKEIIECVNNEAVNLKENILKNENAMNIERLQIKRLAIINREITHRSTHPPISLKYVPLTCNNFTTTTALSEKFVGPKTERNVNEKPNSHVVNNGNIIDKEDRREKDKSKKNNDNATQCRRILLRSSNELKTNVSPAPISTIKPDMIKKIKIRLKGPVESETLTVEREIIRPKDTKNQDLRESSKRVSKRILKNQAKAKKKYKSINAKVSTKKSKKTKKDKIVSSKNIDRIDAPDSIETKIQLVDIEDALSSSKIPKSLDLPKDSENIPDKTANSKNDFDSESKSLQSDRVIQGIDHQTMESENTKSKDCEDSKLKTPKIIQNNHQKINNFQPMLSEKHEQPVKIDGNFISTNLLNESENNHATIVDLDKSTLDTMPVKTLTTREKEEENQSKKLVEKLSLPTNQNKVKYNANIEKCVPINLENCIDSNNATSIPTIDNISIHKTINEADFKLDNVNLSQKYNKPYMHDKHSENSLPLKDKLNFNEKRNQQLATVMHSSKPVNPIDSNSKVNMNNSLTEDEIDLLSLEKEVSVQELPPLDGEPNKRRLRIILPNGKIFKATVTGHMYVSFQSLFSDPSLKRALMNNLNDSKRYTLNIKQVSTVTKLNQNKIVESRIEEINLQKNPLNIETINLLSDEEDLNDSINKTQSFKTEFGLYKVSMMDTRLFEMHQRRFDHKCMLLLNKINILRDNKTTSIPENTPEKDAVGKSAVLLDDSLCKLTQEINDVISNKNNVLHDNKTTGILENISEKDAVGKSAVLLEDSLSILTREINDVISNKNNVLHDNKTTGILENTSEKDAVGKSAVLLEDSLSILTREINDVISNKSNVLHDNKTTGILENTSEKDAVGKSAVLLEDSLSILTREINDVISNKSNVLYDNKTTGILENTSEKDAVGKSAVLLEDSLSILTREINDVISNKSNVLYENKTTGIIDNTSEKDAVGKSAVLLEDSLCILTQEINDVISNKINVLHDDKTTSILENTSEKDAVDKSAVFLEDSLCKLTQEINDVISNKINVLHDDKTTSILENTSEKDTVGKSADLIEDSLCKLTPEINDVTILSDTQPPLQTNTEFAASKSNNEHEVIEIDDSSNDSINLLEDGRLITSLVETKSNFTTNTNIKPEEKINELKSLLLQDLGVNVIENGIQQYSVNVPVSKNEEVDNTLNTSNCYVKLTKCDNLVKKYEQLKIINRKCTVDLIRCDYMTEVINKNVSNDKLDCDSDELIDIGEEDENTQFSSNLSRCNSFSLLNDFSFYTEGETPFDSLSLNASYDERTSPVIDVYETIAAFKNCSSSTIQSEKCHFNCHSEWLKTKHELHIEYTKNITNSHFTYDTIENSSRSMLMNKLIPSLKTLTANLFKNEYLFDHYLFHKRTLISRLPHTLKRKNKSKVDKNNASKCCKLLATKQNLTTAVEKSNINKSCNSSDLKLEIVDQNTDDTNVKNREKVYSTTSSITTGIDNSVHTIKTENEEVSMCAEYIEHIKCNDNVTLSELNDTDKKTIECIENNQPLNTTRIDDSVHTIKTENEEVSMCAEYIEHVKCNHNVTLSELNDTNKKTIKYKENNESLNTPNQDTSTVNKRDAHKYTDNSNNSIVNENTDNVIVQSVDIQYLTAYPRSRKENINENLGTPGTENIGNSMPDKNNDVSKKRSGSGEFNGFTQKITNEIKIRNNNFDSTVNSGETTLPQYSTTTLKESITCKENRSEYLVEDEDLRDTHKDSITEEDTKITVKESENKSNIKNSGLNDVSNNTENIDLHIISESKGNIFEVVAPSDYKLTELLENNSGLDDNISPESGITPKITTIANTTVDIINQIKVNDNSNFTNVSPKVGKYENEKENKNIDQSISKNHSTYVDLHDIRNNIVREHDHYADDAGSVASERLESIMVDENIIEIEIDDRRLVKEDDINTESLLKCEQKPEAENNNIYNDEGLDGCTSREYNHTLNILRSSVFDHIYVLKNESINYDNFNENPTTENNELTVNSNEYPEESIDVHDIMYEESITESIQESLKSPLRKEVTLVYQNDTDIILKGIEFDDPTVGTCYIFPINDDTNDNEDFEVVQILEQSDELDPLDDIEENVLQVNLPKITYSRYGYSKLKELKLNRLKRKRGMNDVKILGKKYRKGKNIDYPKLTFTASANTAYSKEFKTLLDYCSSLKFSFSQPFHKEFIDVENIIKNWPVTGSCSYTLENNNDNDSILFQDLENPEVAINPIELSFIDEITVPYNEPEQLSDNVSENNFNMGFGEGSDRVIQNLEDTDDVSKFSAATLSDVKQPQPFLLSEDYEDYKNITDDAERVKQDQVNKLQQYITYIQLRDKVRSFFKKTTIELSHEWMKQNGKDNSSNSKLSKNYLSNFPFDLCHTDYFEPSPIETVVQVVQVGQLPVSAAAQNPVTCDPRVTQVSNASPSQCSVDNSPQDDSQVTIKTEYTELTTADLTLPLVQEYTQHNQGALVESQDSLNLTASNENIPIETEIKSVVKIELMEELPEVKEEIREHFESNDYESLENPHTNNTEYSFESNNATITNNNNNTAMLQSDTDFPTNYNSSEKQDENETYTPQQKQQNGTPEKTDQIAHAMNAAGITTTAETATNTTRAHALVNILSQKLRQGTIGTAQSVTNSFSKTTAINAMALQQALAQILPPPLNQTNSSENNQQSPNTQVTPQVLHIVQGKNASGSQITLVDNSQQSVINSQNATSVLHIVQNKTGSSVATTSNGTATPQANSFSGLSLVDTGLQQGGNQLLHIVNTGSQKNSNATSQLLKRVNLLTNLTNVQGPNEQKMVQFVCKSADGKAIQLNAPHQRSMVLRLQPIESPNVNVQTTPPKPVENQDINPQANTSNSSPSKDNTGSQQEIKSRSVYEENYAKFIQNSSNKSTISEKSTSLPKFNQAFGKPVFQDGNQKPNEISLNSNSETNECQPTDNAVNLDHIGQISSPPLLLRKSPAQTSQSQPNLVQQLKQSIAPMNIQTMHGGVIYTRQIPVNIGGGQTINLITVPSTELIDESVQNKQTVGNQNEIEQSIIKIVPQTQTTTSTTEMSSEDGSSSISASNESAPNPQPQPVLTQMRIKLPMLSKAPQMVSGGRVVRPSFFQIQRNVIGGNNQPVYQQLVLTAAPPLGQQTIRLPQTQTARQIKVPTENQSSAESQMSSSTLEQLREFDMVLEQVKERSTVQPSSNTNTTFPKLQTPSTDTTDSGPVASSTSTETTQQVLYSIGNNQPLNVAYVNRKTTVTTPTTSSFARSPDSSGIVDSPTSSTQIPHTITSETTQNEPPTQSKPAKTKSKSRPKASSNPPNNLKLNTVPPKTSTQKPLEDEQTTQRILYILAEYKEQVENSPDKDKPAPRRRTNPPSNPGSSKRKKSSSSCRRPCGRDLSPIHGEDTCRTMGSEDSSCGTSQGDCNESCLETHSPQDSPRKVVRKLTFEQETPAPQPRPQPQRNVIVADGQTITVARGTAGKPTTAVLMPANYILPVSMVKGGQQIAIVTNRGPKLLTVGGGEGGATNALLLQRLIGPAGLKPMLARPGVRHVRLPTAALHNLQAFNLATTTTIQPPDSTASPAPAPTPPELIDTRATSSPWTDREGQDVKPERASSPEGSEPWNLPSSGDPQDYSYEETVRTDNLDRTVLDPIPDRYSPDMEAQRIFDKMFDVESKKSYMGDSHDDSPRCAYDIDASDCDDKAYHQVVQKKDVSSHRQHRLTHVSAAALRHKYAILEHELRLQKSLSEECEDLGVDSPSASELFPEAELLFAASPAHDHNQDQANHSHTPQPTLLSQSSIPQPDMDDQIATDQLLSRDISEDQQDLNLGLEDVGIVTVSEDGMQATIALDQEEFARSHPNTTFHSEPTDEGEVQPFTITGLKSRHITSTIFHANRVPATVLMTAPQTTVISQATPENNVQNAVKYSDIDNVINSIPSGNTNINLASVLVKDDGLTRFDNILSDSRELHLSNTASAIIHSASNATQVIRRVCYDEDKRDTRFLMDEPEALIAGDDAKMIAEDSSRDATLESMAGDEDDDRSLPERHAELFWESNSASERSESRRPMDFSSDSEKCCKSPSYDETNSTDSSGVGTHMRLDSVIKEARGVERSGSADGSSADDTHPPLRTYPPKRLYHPLEGEMERSLSGKTRAGERSPDSLEVRRRASGRGVVKRGCHCCNGSPAPPRPKKSRQRKPTMDFTTN